jgi:hypothetical protein
VLVDGDDLVAGVDGEEQLGQGWRQRDDALWLLSDLHVAVVGADDDGECRLRAGGACRSRFRRGGVAIVAAAGGDHRCGEQDCGHTKGGGARHGALLGV